MIELIGGPDRDRTDDLFHAMEARSQLRHRPTLSWKDFIYFLLPGTIRQTWREHPASCWCLSNQSERALGRRRRSSRLLMH
jgi:hypothetical protein